ncbi:Retrovirus-related Pol polyprotein from transposon 17.6, partial [Mucuna pruriens]
MPMILVLKKDGTWRMCIDCRPINNIIVTYKYLIPRLDDLLDELHGSQMYGRRINGKQISRKKFGHYEWLGMPFGLTNTPFIFMRLINHVSRSFIGKCVYFDDILIYSTCLNDHLLHVRSVLEIWRKETLFANLEKCIFFTNDVIFLGFVVGFHGVKVDREKVKAIQDWPMPKTIAKVKSFHGLAKAQERAFQVLKERLTQAPILALPNFSKSFELECDASCVGIGVVLLQEGHLIAYFSEKLKSAYLNYSTYD